MNYRGLALVLILAMALLASPRTGLAGDDDQQTAEQLMTWQLAAIKDGDYQHFIEHGNRAFRELMDQGMFEILQLQRRNKLTDGYTLEYLGQIRRIGMRQHLWRVSFSDKKYELLGSLTLADGHVAGFNLD